MPLIPNEVTNHVHIASPSPLNEELAGEMRLHLNIMSKTGEGWAVLLWFL